MKKGKSGLSDISKRAEGRGGKKAVLCRAFPMLPLSGKDFLHATLLLTMLKMVNASPIEENVPNRHVSFWAMSSSQLIKKRKEESAFIITIDNPPVNALNFKLLEELVAAVNEGNSDPEVRGIVITGSGTNAFCAGADLRMMQELRPEDAEKITGIGHDAFNAIENCPKPVLVAINGLALGGGCELAMSCDLRFASDRARFGQPEVTLGLIPAWGGTQRMSRLIGRAKAKELIFSGQMVSAQEALRIGLVNKVVPDGEELRAAVDYVRMLAAKTSPFAVMQAKMAINKGLSEPSTEKGLQYEVEAVRAIAQSSDLREGIEAFLAKRPPKYTGK